MREEATVRHPARLQDYMTVAQGALCVVWEGLAACWAVRDLGVLSHNVLANIADT
jgi:hypothetical protein